MASHFFDVMSRQSNLLLAMLLYNPLRSADSTVRNVIVEGKSQAGTTNETSTSVVSAPSLRERMTVHEARFQDARYRSQLFYCQ